MPVAPIPLDATLYTIYIPQELQVSATTALNSTVTMLLTEYAGRTNMSGIIELKVYEAEKLQVPNPYGISPVSPQIFAASDHPLVTRDRRTESGFRLTLTDTRRKIDEPVFAYLGLTRGEQDAVYNETYDAIVKRQLAEANVA